MADVKTRDVQPAADVLTAAAATATALYACNVTNFMPASIALCK